MNLKLSQGMGVTLLVIGVILVLIVFAKAYQEYNNVNVSIGNSSDVMQAITSSSGLLIQLLFKLAYLGLALAAGSVLIKYSIPIIKEEKREESKG
ncbi:MAG: hypothetical protein GSR82_00935 [Desulfurococcales archaeon]|nr:hypothetical protein [Desulfurococcales archaeon]